MFQRVKLRNSEAMIGPEEEHDEADHPRRDEQVAGERFSAPAFGKITPDAYSR
ncbi:MAG: hypothetical protein HND48_15700 [Chloroflexi bacterium]|nr:hypothetical protein [Chloroflexota bacterium]